MSLYSFQDVALQAILGCLKKTGRALLVMATGLGKSWIAAYYAKQAIPHGRGLVLCHDNTILRQNLRTFKKVLGEDVSLGIFNGNRKDMEEVNILFATFQTFNHWKEAFFKDEFYFIIVDEAHHTEANTFKPVVEYFEPKDLFGMTATPDRMDNRDIRKTFGEATVHVSLETGIARGWLSPVEYHVLSDNTDTSKLKELLARAEAGDRRVSVKQLNENIFIQKRDDEIAEIIMRHNKRAIIFCERTRHADLFAQHLVSAAAYHSGNTRKRNARILQAFRDGELKYILTVDKFNEGIDVPEVELIVFLRCTDSPRIFLQQLGRGLRRVPGKDKVVVLDFVGNCERVIMVQQMVERIAAESKMPPELDKTELILEGEGFNFVFSNDLRDILEIVRLVQTKVYIAAIPHLLADYSDKNELPAEEVRAGTNEKLRWKCSTANCGYEWQTTGAHRVKGTGCPACVNQAVTPNNCMSKTHPELATEFHPTKNAPDTPHSVMAGTNRKLWWKCSKPDCGHEWQASASTRKSGINNCPTCSGLATTHPKLAVEFHPTLNAPISPKTVPAGTRKKLWWKCSKPDCRYEWRAKGAERKGSMKKKGSGCPACAGKVVTTKNCMATTHPELTTEFHPTLNSPKTPHNVVAGTGKRLWWKCIKANCGYEWQARGAERKGSMKKKGSGCPACAGRVVTTKNCMATTHPELAAEFHSTKNRGLTASDVVAGTNKKLHWKCSVPGCGHEWQTQGKARIQSNGCPACGRKKRSKTRRKNKRQS